MRKDIQLTIKKMRENYAVEVLCWKYEKPYDLYNNVLTGSAILELVTSNYYVILDEYQELIGFFCIGTSAQVPAGDDFGAYVQECIDVGIGMKPQLTGKGNGYLFFSKIIEFIKEMYKGKDIRLTVATFNERAIHLYKKLGFVEQLKFKNNGIEFITMIKSVDKN